VFCFDSLCLLLPRPKFVPRARDDRREPRRCKDAFTERSDAVANDWSFLAASTGSDSQVGNIQESLRARGRCDRR